MLAPEFGLESQPQPFIWLVDGGSNIGVHNRERREFDVEVSALEWFRIGVDLWDVLAGGVVGYSETVGNVSQGLSNIAHLKATPFFPMRLKMFGLHKGQWIIADVSNRDVGSHREIIACFWFIGDKIKDRREWGGHD